MKIQIFYLIISICIFFNINAFANSDSIKVYNNYIYYTYMDSKIVSISCSEDSIDTYNIECVQDSMLKKLTTVFTQETMFMYLFDIKYSMKGIPPTKKCLLFMIGEANKFLGKSNGLIQLQKQ